MDATLPLSRDEIIALASRLEVPDCGCKLVFLDCGCRRLADQFKDLAKRLRQDKIDAMTADDIEAVEDIEREIKRAVESEKAHRQCDCPVLLGPPCEHILARGDSWPGGYSYDDWIDLLAAFNEYKQPPTPPEPRLALDRAPRIALYATRFSKGQHWRHNEDIIDPNKLPGGLQDIGRAGARRLRNGKDVEVGITTGRKMKEQQHESKP